MIFGNFLKPKQTKKKKKQNKIIKDKIIRYQDTF